MLSGRNCRIIHGAIKTAKSRKKVCPTVVEPILQGLINICDSIVYKRATIREFMGNCDFSLPALPTNNKTPGRAYYSTRCFVVCPNSVPIKNRVFGLSFNGGPEEIRTLDLSDANRTLSQLSYRPNSNCLMIITRSFFKCNTFFNFLYKSFFRPIRRENDRKIPHYLRQNRLSGNTFCRKNKIRTQGQPTASIPF